MSPEALLLASIQGPVQASSTGDRETDMVLSAFAGLAWPGYAGEIDPSLSLEHAWADAVLGAKPMPALVLPADDGYPLTHAVFYATDFARRPVNSKAGRDRVMAASLRTEDGDLLCEYGMCMMGLGGAPTLRMTAAMANPRTEHHAVVASILDALMKRG